MCLSNIKHRDQKIEAFSSLPSGSCGWQVVAQLLYKQIITMLKEM